MIYIIILAIGIMGALLLGGKAFSGPNPRKSVKRRMELLKERHADRNMPEHLFQHLRAAAVAQWQGGFRPERHDTSPGMRGARPQRPA